MGRGREVDAAEPARAWTGRSRVTWLPGASDELVEQDGEETRDDVNGGGAMEVDGLQEHVHRARTRWAEAGDPGSVEKQT